MGAGVKKMIDGEDVDLNGIKEEVPEYVKKLPDMIDEKLKKNEALMRGDKNRERYEEMQMMNDELGPKYDVVNYMNLKPAETKEQKGANTWHIVNERDYQYSPGNEINIYETKRPKLSEDDENKFVNKITERIMMSIDLSKLNQPPPEPQIIIKEIPVKPKEEEKKKKEVVKEEPPVPKVDPRKVGGVGFGGGCIESDFVPASSSIPEPPPPAPKVEEEEEEPPKVKKKKKKIIIKKKKKKKPKKKKKKVIRRIIYRQPEPEPEPEEAEEEFEEEPDDDVNDDYEVRDDRTGEFYDYDEY